jgi:ABC-type multidrug transport system permease subunit
MMSFVRAAWAMYKQDLAIWAHHPVIVVTSLAPALLIILLLAAEAAAVGRSPVALVTLDTNPKGRQMQQIFQRAGVFRLTDASPEQAQTLLKHLDVVAVITIPADFTRRVEAHDPSPVDVTINNLNLDFTNDIRRAVPDAITQFYAAQGSTNPIKVTMQEHDLRSQDVQYFQYLVLPAIVLLLVTAGLMTNGTATAEEWETRRIKELLLAPVARSALIIGKVLAGFTTAFLMGVLVLTLGAALGWTRPEGLYIVTSLLIMALIALFSTGLGVALGAALQRTQLVTTVSVLVAFSLFFLAGGIGVLAFEPTWVQNIAALSPLSYGAHALEQAVFYSSSDQLGRDVLVLSLSGLGTLVLGVLMMRRGIAS